MRRAIISHRCSRSAQPTNNGNTWFDRTNYFATVPTGALDRAVHGKRPHGLSARRGFDQAKLDAQRGVVQNEKRQGDNQPYGHGRLCSDSRDCCRPIILMGMTPSAR
jgi:predicted Zn-dependent peptidase